MEDAILIHHGIKGQRWGVRRYQNADGSLTAAGKKRYTKEEKKEIRKERKELNNKYKEEYLKNSKYPELEKEYDDLVDKYNIDADGGIDTYNWRTDEWRDLTHEEEKAVARFHEIEHEMADLYDEAYLYAKEKTGEDLAEKYGKETIKQIETEDNIKGGVATVALITAELAIMALPIIALSNAMDKAADKLTDRATRR